MINLRVKKKPINSGQTLLKAMPPTFPIKVDWTIDHHSIINKQKDETRKYLSTTFFLHQVLPSLFSLFFGVSIAHSDRYFRQPTDSSLTTTLESLTEKHSFLLCDTTPIYLLWRDILCKWKCNVKCI